MVSSRKQEGVTVASSALMRQNSVSIKQTQKSHLEDQGPARIEWKLSP